MDNTDDVVIPLEPNNPPPDIDNPAIPLADPVADAKASSANIHDAKRDFFADASDDEPPATPHTPPKPTEAAPPAKDEPAVATPKEGDKDDDDDLIPQPDDDAIPAEDQQIIDEWNEEKAERARQALDKAKKTEDKTDDTKPPEEPAADDAATEFKTDAGLTYKVTTSDGKTVDLAQKDAKLVLNFNGKETEVDVSKIPDLVSMGLSSGTKNLQVKHQLGQLTQEAQRLQRVSAELEAREGDINRFWTDPDYRAAVEKNMEEANRPENRVAMAEAKTARVEQEAVHKESVNYANWYESTHVGPKLEQLSAAHPGVPPDVIQDKYNVVLAQFGETELAVTRQGNQFVASSPQAWARFQSMLDHDLPAMIAKVDSDIKATMNGSTEAAELEAKKAKAEAEAANTKAELLRNKAADRQPKSSGLPPNREKPAPKIKTYQDGKKWLQED